MIIRELFHVVRRLTPHQAPAARVENTPGEPFADYADRWLARRVAEGFKSEQDYRGTLDNYLIPGLGDKPLGAITPRDVREFLSNVRSRTKKNGNRLAPRTVGNIYAVLRNILASAVADEALERSPCVLRKTDLPKNVDADPEFRTKAKFSDESPLRLRLRFVSRSLDVCSHRAALAADRWPASSESMLRGGPR